MNNKIIIRDQIFEIVSLEDYNPDVYDPKTTVIQKGGNVYPIKSFDDSGPGFYTSPQNPIQIFQEPDDEDAELYQIREDNTVNFQDIKSMAECIAANDKFLSMERSILTSPDNIFTPPIGDNDEPAMKALKEAIMEKHIDIDKYSARFGPNYGNTKRLFKDGGITLNKLIYVADNLDMKCTLTIEDSAPDVPNPIGRVIVTSLSSIDSEESK